MRKLFLTVSLISGIFFFISPVVFAAATTSPDSKPFPPHLYKSIGSLKVKDIQKITGKKLSLKEKIAFTILKHKLRRLLKENTGSGQTSFIFGIASLVLFVAGLFLPFLLLIALVAAILAVIIGSMAYKRNSSDRKAHAGKLMGWLTLGLLALLLIVIAIALSSWNWGWG